MRTAEEIQAKRGELEDELDGLDDALEEQAEDEDIKEMTPGRDRLEAEYEYREKALKGQIALLEWVLGEK